MNSTYSTPLVEKQNLYPKFMDDSTNYRIKKIMDDSLILQNCIKERNILTKKYTRVSTVLDVLEYLLISGDIIIGTAAAAIPGVGPLIPTTIFSGVGVISGIAKFIQTKLNEKKQKHSNKATEASTTLHNLHFKISKAINDGEISHNEFEDIQNTINDWRCQKDQYTENVPVNPEFFNSITKEVTEKTQKQIIEHLKKMQLVNS